LDTKGRDCVGVVLAECPAIDDDACQARNTGFLRPRPEPSLPRTIDALAGPWPPERIRVGELIGRCEVHPNEGEPFGERASVAPTTISGGFPKHVSRRALSLYSLSFFSFWLGSHRPNRGLGFRGKVIWILPHAVLLKPLLSLRHVLERETLGDNAVHMPFYAPTR
jgi:hypothetical protein